jgi:phosphoglycolate phosphatase
VYDEPYEGINKKLIELKKKYTLILITARQFVKIVDEQINKFNWNGLFKKVLVTEQKINKENLILQNVKLSEDDWLIGDTGKDIQAGKFLKIKTAGVLSGFRNKENLAKYSPDIILDSVTDFTK